MKRLDLAGDLRDSFNVSLFVEGIYNGKGYGISMVRRSSYFAMNSLNANKILAAVKSLNSPAMQLF